MTLLFCFRSSRLLCPESVSINLENKHLKDKVAQKDKKIKELEVSLNTYVTKVEQLQTFSADVLEKEK